jgi:hypothetical protein
LPLKKDFTVKNLTKIDTMTVFELKKLLLNIAHVANITLRDSSQYEPNEQGLSDMYSYADLEDMIVMLRDTLKMIEVFDLPELDITNNMLTQTADKMPESKEEVRDPQADTEERIAFRDYFRNK